MSVSVPVPNPLPAEAAETVTHGRRRFWGLALGSIGVVYGDIGTSPLYAFKESVKAAAGGGASPRRWSSACSPSSSGR